MNSTDTTTENKSHSPYQSATASPPENQPDRFTPFHAFYGFLRVISEGARDDSSFANLEPEQHAVILNWITHHTLAEVRELLRKQKPDGFEIDCSLTAIWRYKEKYLPIYRQAQRQRDQFIALYGKQPTQEDVAAIQASTLQSLRHLLFTMVNEAADAAKIKALFSVLQKFDDQRLAERRVGVIEKKVEAYDKAKAALQQSNVDPLQMKIEIEKYFGV